MLVSSQTPHRVFMTDFTTVSHCFVSRRRCPSGQRRHYGTFGSPGASPSGRAWKGSMTPGELEVFVHGQGVKPDVVAPTLTDT